MEGIMRLESFILNRNKKTIDIVEIMQYYGANYEGLVREINALIFRGILEPVAASGSNGRRPAMHNRYRIKKTEVDYTNAYDEIRMLHAKFDHQVYFDRPELYLKYRTEIQALSDFLWNRRNEIDEPMSINERSLSIFGREKYLRENYSLFSGIFKMKEFSLEDLNFYETPEPFFEYVFENSKDSNILVIENKDTWYTLRKVMKDRGCNRIFGVPFHCLIYGEGKKVTRSRGRLREYQDEILGSGSHTFYYFGDLDFEGISIYQETVLKNPEVRVVLFKELYSLMIIEGEKIILPETRDHREPRADLDAFLSHFTVEESQKITNLLKEKRYIPQEILNYHIFDELVKGNGYV